MSEHIRTAEITTAGIAPIEAARASLWRQVHEFFLLPARVSTGQFDGIAHVRTSGSERGAVSLEQVLWFVAAGLSVAVVAGILWTQIRTQASTPINVPSAP